MGNSEYRKKEGRAMTLKEAVDTLDGVIPAPDNKMVDLDHLSIAIAWQRIKAVLPPIQDDEGALTYQDIRPEINELCKEHPGCWRIPAVDAECPYTDVCRKKYEGPHNGTAAFEAAMLARYKELKAGTKYGISILPEACLAYRDGFRFGAYKAIPDGETTVVEFFKTEEEIREFVAGHPQFGKRAKS